MAYGVTEMALDAAWSHWLTCGLRVERWESRCRSSYERISSGDPFAFATLGFAFLFTFAFAFREEQGFAFT
jgi:hypothetical protein